LQLYEIFNVRLHPSDEVYGIWRLLRKSGAGRRTGMGHPAFVDGDGRAQTLCGEKESGGQARY
jgi:hypothetical protein